jgi:hypothetical protein
MPVLKFAPRARARPTYTQRARFEFTKLLVFPFGARAGKRRDAGPRNLA